MASFQPAFHIVNEEKAAFEFIEDNHNISESILNTPVEIQKNRVYLPAYLPQDYQCPRKISRVKAYIVYSGTIVPSLNVASIIFPFHSFL